MSFSLRPAVAADQPVINEIVRGARINPRHLDWPRFLVAESQSQIIGVGQVRLHPDGSRELASIAVLPEFHRQGVGSAICRALVERENGPLFLICLQPLGAFYSRFGFSVATVAEMPPHFRRIHRLFSPMASILRPITRTSFLIMKREGGTLHDST